MSTRRKRLTKRGLAKVLLDEGIKPEGQPWLRALDLNAQGKPAAYIVARVRWTLPRVPRRDPSWSPPKRPLPLEEWERELIRSLKKH